MFLIVSVALATAIFLIIWWLLSLEETVIWKSSYMGEFGPGTRRMAVVESMMIRMEECGVIRLSNALILRSKAPLTEHHIRKALFGLAQRHPLLRARILTAENDEKSVYFKQLDDIKINLTVVDGNDWQSVLEDQMLLSYDVKKEPLWRVVFLPKTDYNDGEEGTEYAYQSACVFGFHHAITDGTSYARLFSELLDRLHDVTTDVVPDIIPYDLRPPLDAYIKPMICKRWNARLARNLVTVILRNFPFVTRFMLRQFAEPSLYVKKFGIELARDPSTQKRTCIIPIEFTQDETSQLLAMCKKHKSTVHGAILTAASTAFVSILQDGNVKDDITIAANSTCNMRPHLRTVIPADYLGPYFLFVPLKQTIGPSTIFWDEASEATRRIHKFLEERRPVDMFSMMASLGDVTDFMKPNPQRDLTDGNRRGGLVFTNLGNLKFLNRDSSSAVRLTARYGCSGEHETGQVFGSNLATFNGKLFWTFVYYRNIVSKVEAQRYADLTKDVLLTAIKE